MEYGLDHAVEHVVGIYILLVGLACLVGILVRHLMKRPYTIALTVMGLFLAIFKIGPEIAETGFSKGLVFFVLLPPLLFQGALHMQLDRLRKHALMITVFATIGVLVTTFIVAGITFGLSVFENMMIAMLFGAIICTTDPVSVLSIFKQYNVSPDLKYLVEGESLLNDGTGVVIFSIIIVMIRHNIELSAFSAFGQFLLISFGGAFIGLGFGFIAYQLLRRLNDHLLENLICVLLCYSSFWVAEHFHLSGVIAVVSGGLLIGNYGRSLAMEPKTTETIETFFESIDFIINSLLFILIGLELKAIPLEDMFNYLPGILISIAAVLLARAVVVYSLYFATRKMCSSKYPGKWSHILIWGGLKGSIPIALLLGLPAHALIDEYRTPLLVIGFSVVFFSLIVQGLTLKPLMNFLSLQIEEKEEEDPAHDVPGAK